MKTSRRSVCVCVQVYLAADGEKRIAGCVHENNLSFVAGDVIVDAKDEVSIRVEHRETVAVKEQRFLPDGEHHRFGIAVASINSFWRRR